MRKHVKESDIERRKSRERKRMRERREKERAREKSIESAEGKGVYRERQY